GGVNVYVPGKWGLLNLEVVNPLPEPHELLSTTYFEGQPTLQFGRRIWVPARSRLRTWQPVLAPEITAPVNEIEFHSLVLKSGAEDKVAAREDTGQVLHSGLLPVDLEKQITGLLENHDESRTGDPDWDTARNLVIAARLSQRMSTRLAAPREQNFLPVEASLQSLQ